MDSFIGCWYQLQVADVANEDGLLNAFLIVDEDVIVIKYPINDKILYSVKMKISIVEKIWKINEN